MFPNFAIFTQAITFYGTIRAIYDIDNVGYGFAILAYIRQLAAWVQQGLSWTGILMYAIGHFGSIKPRGRYQTPISNYMPPTLHARGWESRSVIYGKEKEL